MKSPVTRLTSASTTSMTEKKRPTPQRGAVQRAACQTLEDRCLFSFSAAVPYATGSGSQSVLTADFNGDSRLDLAVLNTQSSTVSVLFGNTNGTFQPAVSFATAAFPRSLAVGDFNGDSKPDLVTTNSGGLNVSLNNGSGGFAAPGSTISIPDDPRSVAVGDFNGDGKLDLAATSSVHHDGSWGYWGYYPAYDVSQATVLVGNGTGSFSAAGSTGYTYGYEYGAFTSLAVADFNSDGKQDLAMASADNYAVRVFYGSSNGALVNGASFNSGSATAITAGDVTGDGKADIVEAGAYASVVLVLAGNGLGSFAAAQSYDTGPTPVSVAIGDFNVDGKADIVTANTTDSSLAVLRGLGTGAFQPAIQAGGSSGVVSIAVGDFNGDGRADVATANGTSNTASALLNDGVWTAATSPRITINDVTASEGNSGTTNATFIVTLSAASTETVTVNYTTEDGSATSGSDYQPVSGTLTFLPGQTSQTIPVPVIGDRLAESTEYFGVKLSSATKAFVTDPDGLGTIIDDEPRIYIDSPGSITEGNSGTTAMTFSVRLGAASDQPVSVNFSVTEGDTQDWYWDNYYYGTQPATAGADFKTDSGTVTFAPSETVKYVTVLVNGDVTAEPREAFLVRLSNADGGVIASAPAVGVIIDDEPYATISTSVTKKEGNTGTTAFVYTVTLSAPAVAPFTVNYATVDGSATAASGDYQAAAGAVTFATGQTSQNITVLVNGDRLPEYDESFYVQLTGSTGAHTGGYGYATIQDDDPRLSVNSVSKNEGNSGTSTLRFTISLAFAYDQPVSVNFKTLDGTATAGSDYQAKSGTLTFAAGETFKFVDVVIYGDTTKESDEYFSIQLYGASSNAWIYGEYGSGYIINDDTKPGNRGGKK